MKYISTFILVVLLGWTWCLANSERPMTLEQHKHVEAGVEEDIRALIQRRFPSTTDIYCPQFYTEMLSSGTEMIAHFRCQVANGKNTDDSTEQIFEGELRLKSEDGFNTWSETGGEIRGKEIRFLNGVKITPHDKDGEPVTPEAPAEKH